MLCLLFLSNQRFQVCPPTPSPTHHYHLHQNEDVAECFGSLFWPKYTSPARQSVLATQRALVGCQEELAKQWHRTYLAKSFNSPSKKFRIKTKTTIEHAYMQICCAKNIQVPVFWTLFWRENAFVLMCLSMAQNYICWCPQNLFGGSIDGSIC